MGVCRKSGAVALCAVFLISTLMITIPVVAESKLWKSEFETSQNKISSYQKAHFFSLDKSALAARLGLVSNNEKQAENTNSDKSRKQLGAKSIPHMSIELPLPNGETISVNVIEYSVLSAHLSAKYPAIKTFKVLPDARVSSGKLDITPSGFHGILQMREGQTILIDPVSKGLHEVTKGSEKQRYASYAKHNQQQKVAPFSCSAEARNESHSNHPRDKIKPLASKAGTRSPKSLLTYRIAIAATGEYTQKHGGTVVSALSAIVTTLNRVNQVYEQDLGIHLKLVENNDQIIYTDPDTDPYYDANDRKSLLLQNQNNIDAVIGSANYDIGHLFSTSGGGLAAISSVCSSNRKGQGVSGSHYVNDSFALDFVAHEIGHQFGATHSFNGTAGLCAGKTRTAHTAFEPGSGSSIMSYAGYCGRDNLQRNSDAMFHIGNIEQIRSYASIQRNKGCGVQSPTLNTLPVVDAGQDYSIPANTPFLLKGKATDADDDSLIYTWEQTDVGTASPENIDKGNNALFRIHLPSQSAMRSFPPLNDILNHRRNRGENLPIQQREMHFKFVVQDGYNIAQSDAMKIQVKRTGSRFALNMPRSQYSLGSTHKVLWNVANTDSTPISCQNVDIKLSVNSGQNFDYTLAEAVPNTGEAWVTIPATINASSQGRFKVSCSDNIFFAISYRNFALNNQAHEDRLKLADEDKPEPNLQDKSIKQTPPPVVTSAASAGGTFEWLLLLLWAVRFFVGRQRINKF